MQINHLVETIAVAIGVLFMLAFAFAGGVFAASALSRL